MSSGLRRSRRPGRAPHSSLRVAGFHRHKWLLLAVIAGLVVAALLVVWLPPWLGIVSNLAPMLRGDAANEQLPISHTSSRAPVLSPNSSVEDLKEELRQVADQLAKSFPNEANALDVVARVEFSLGRRKEAMEIWKKCTQLNANDASAYFAAMGIVAANGGSPEEAAQFFREALEAGSRDPQIPVLLADNLMKARQLEEAVAVLENQQQSGAISAAGLTTLGQAYLELDQCEKAETVFHASIHANPDAKTAYYGLARACARLGRSAEAKSYMQQFAQREAQESSRRTEGFRTFSDESSSRQVVLRACIDAARCYRAHQKTADAEYLLQNAAALVPEDVESRTDLMTLYEQTGRDRSALQVCEQMRRIDPRNADYWMNVGVLHARLGNFEEGLAALREALQLDPHNAKYRRAYDLIAQEK